MNVNCFDYREERVKSSLEDLRRQVAPLSNAAQDWEANTTQNHYPIRGLMRDTLWKGAGLVQRGLNTLLEMSKHGLLRNPTAIEDASTGGKSPSTAPSNPAKMRTTQPVAGNKRAAPSSFDVPRAMTLAKRSKLASPRTGERSTENGIEKRRRKSIDVGIGDFYPPQKIDRYTTVGEKEKGRLTPSGSQEKAREQDARRKSSWSNPTMKGSYRSLR